MKSLSCEKPVDPKVAIEEAKKSIERAKLNLKLINGVLEVVENFRDKTISRRLLTKIKEHPAFDGYIVTYDDRYSFIAIKVNGGIIEEGGSFSALICYKNYAVIIPEFVREHNVCYTLEEKRIKEMEERIGEIEEVVERYNVIVAEAKALYQKADGLGMRHLLKL